MGTTKFTPEVRRAIIDHIRNGNHITVAVRAAGVEYQTFKRWMEIGEYRSLDRNPEPDYIAFAEEVRRAEAECEAEIVAKIRTEAMLSPEIGLKFLARRHPDRWSDREPPRHNIHWVVQATEMLRRGDITLELIESELGAELASEVRKALAPPEQPNYSTGQVIDAEARPAARPEELDAPGASGENQGAGKTQEA